MTYGTDARIVLEPTSTQDAGRIVEAIHNLWPDGSTNAEAGLRLGYRLAADTFREGAINRVVLASDGVANVGVTDPEELLRRVEWDRSLGIELVTVGFGMGNYNDTLMEQLADHGDGFYAYVNRLEDAERLFGEDLVGTLQAVALDAKAQVVFDPGWSSRTGSSATRTGPSPTTGSATTRWRPARSARATRRPRCTPCASPATGAGATGSGP